MIKRNRLWNPEHEHEQRKRKPTPKTPSDPLCATCPNKIIKYIDNGIEKEMPCRGLCPPMQWIDGNVASKETLMTDINAHDMEYRDYKDDLVEMMEHRQHRINTALTIPIVKHRAIAILLLSGITQKDISTLFRMSIKQINRISLKVK
jgi:hypothetical protein